jgi:hypothetical protein
LIFFYKKSTKFKENGVSLCYNKIQIITHQKINMNFFKKNCLLGISIMTFIGCSTLNLTTEQTIKTYSDVNEKTIYKYYDFRLGIITALARGEQFNNGLKYVYAYNKDGKRCKVRITDKTTLRITKQNGARVNMYFDTSFLKDSCLYGNLSHFIDLPAGPYKITEMKKIEIQTTNNLLTIEE